MMQIENLQTFSYVDSLLPNLIWLSALFLRCDGRTVVEKSIAFLRMCHELVDRQDAPALAAFQNFNHITDAERQLIRSKSEELGFRQFLCENLRHQNRLISRYPLAFLFESEPDELEIERDIDLLSEDVEALLDRYSHHSTKVQTTAFVAHMATGKMHLSSDIDLPDFDSIFTAPDSDAAKHVASFVRASTNAGVFRYGHSVDEWTGHFWKEAHALRGCI